MPQIVKRSSDSIYVQSDVDCTIDVYLRGDNVYELVDNFSYTASSDPFYAYVIAKDGLYKVTVTVVATPTDTILAMYPDLITNIAKEFISFVCTDCNEYLKDCGCNDLPNNAKASLKYNNLASKILYLETAILTAHSDIDRLNYQDFLLSVLKTIACKGDGLLAKILLEECIKGMSDNMELYKLLLIIRYFGLYLLELNNSNNLIDEIEGVSSTTSMDELYRYDEWEDCLCKTCLRKDEVITIFEEGIDDTEQTPTNYPPTAQNLFRQIVSETSYYNYDLLQADFNADFNDDNDNFPTSIKIVGLPPVFIFEDTNDVLVTLNQVIPFGDIENYRVNHTEVGNPTINNEFLFKVVDSEGLLSPTYGFRFALLRLSNSPPVVTKDFGVVLDGDSVALIKKLDFFTKGFVYDPEGDEITLAKVFHAQQVTMELWDGNAYQPYLVDDEITLANYSDLEEFLRITYTGIPSPIQDIRGTDEPLIRFAFKDAGSLEYSNDDVVANFMTVDFTLIYPLTLKFTGGYSLKEAIIDKNWIPLARVEYDGLITDLLTVLVAQTGYISGSVPFIIIPATDDTPFDVYKNASSIVIAGTDNPTINSYDIYAYTNALVTRAISFKIQEKGIDKLNITSDILVKTTGSKNPVKMYFLEFDETNIADFVAYETAIPADFLATVPNPALSIDFDDAVVGATYTITSAGLIGFALVTKELRNPVIYDAMGNNVTSLMFKKFFDPVSQLELYISYGVYAPSTLTLKFEF